MASESVVKRSTPILVGFGCWLAVGAGCAHDGDTRAERVTKATGHCPTEVQHAVVAVVEGEGQIDVRIMAQEGADALAIQQRVEEIAEALVRLHPARPQGAPEPIQHVPVYDVRWNGVPNGAVLTFMAKDEANMNTLRERINDHVVRWRQGECPILNDESVRPEEMKGWDTANR